MTGQEVVKRLKAFKAGKPLPLGETLRIRPIKPADILIVCFVRMGGESAPWGIAFGQPGKAPRILTVPEPRNRDYVADMVAEFAPTLLKYLQHPAYGGRMVESGQELAERQVWLPNASHLEMLHHLNYAYVRSKFGTPKRAELLKQLGRAAGWLFRESQRPGQTAVVVATEALKRTFTFPAEDMRQGHLGFLLAWLRTKGGRAARMAAAEAEERNSISTSLNPSEERDELEPALGQFNDARSRKDERAQQRYRHVIDGQLHVPLRRRFELTEAAIDVLQDDSRRPNSGLDLLSRASRDEQYRQYLRVENRLEDPEDGPPFVPSPETDRSPAAAASRYFVQQASQQLLETLLVHDDRELQDEMIAEGKAVRGQIVEVYDEDPGRKTVPIWTLDADATLPLRLTEGSDVCVVGCRNRTGDIRSVETVKGRYRIEVQITGCVTVPRNDPTVLPATSPKLRGKVVTLVPPPKDGISRLKSRKVWDSDVAGKHLTHPALKRSRNELPTEITEQESVEV